MRRILAFAAILVLAGCAGIPRDLETPEVEFVGIRGVQAGLFEQRFDLRLRVRNPNRVELPVRGLDVDVELAGEPFAHGVSAREFVVPAGGEAEFDMKMTANAVAALRQLASGDVAARGEVPYRLKGKLSTRLGLLRSIPFDEEGTLPLSDLAGKRKGNR